MAIKKLEAKISNILEDEYHRLYSETLPNIAKLDVLSNIIQTKKDHVVLSNHTQSIYKDFKYFISLSIATTETAEYRYDGLKVESFVSLLNNIGPNAEEELMLYYIRKLDQSAFKDEIKFLKKKYYKKVVFNSIKTPYKFESIVKIFAYTPLINTYTILLTFLFVALIAILVPLNAPFEFMAFLDFIVKYHHFSEVFIVNHTLNILSNLIGIETDFQLLGRDAFTQTVIIISKIMLFLFITNILVRKINDYLILKK